VESVADYKEIIDVIKESGGDAFKRCFQCGLCDTVCPWNRVRNFSMRKLVRQATFGFTEIESEEMWLCTTCGRCPQHCPRDVQQIESGVALRRVATEYGVFPDSVKPIRTAVGSLIGEGNPLGEERKSRGDWAKGQSVKTFSEEMEILYFPGCYPSFDPRAKKIATATAKILNQPASISEYWGPKRVAAERAFAKPGMKSSLSAWPRKTSRHLLTTA
jgi:heterodisulfide reductase subunit C